MVISYHPVHSQPVPRMDTILSDLALEVSHSKAAFGCRRPSSAGGRDNQLVTSPRRPPPLRVDNGCRANSSRQAARMLDLLTLEAVAAMWPHVGHVVQLVVFDAEAPPRGDFHLT